MEIRCEEQRKHKRDEPEMIETRGEVQGKHNEMKETSTWYTIPMVYST